MAAGGMVQIPLTLDKSSASTLQDQLTDGIRHLVKSGVLRPGTRLPASRELSNQLKISRNTIKTAYLNLISEGYLSSRGTRGTYVAPSSPDAVVGVSTQQAGLTPNYPVLPLRQSLPSAALGIQQQLSHHLPGKPGKESVYDYSLRGLDSTMSPERTLRRLLLAHLPHRTKYFGKENPPGHLVLRQSIADYLCPIRGIKATSDDIIVVGDETRALDAIVNTLFPRGTPVAVEDPCDAKTLFLLRTRGLNVIPIEMDGHGIIVNKLYETKLSAIFVQPTHQRPTGVTMSLARREQLLNWSSETGSTIIEIDTFGEFSYDETPLPPLYSMDWNERVIYINSFSKWIGGQNGVGYALLPRGIRSQFLKLQEFFDPAVPWLEQRVLADFISSDGFFPHLRRIRQTLLRRRNAVLEAITGLSGEASVSGQQSGCHVVWRLPTDFPNALELREIASENGIVMQTCYDGFCKIGLGRRHFDQDRNILIGYSAISEEDAQLGIIRIADIMQRSSPISKRYFS